ncbi:SpaA isopeptide-forming pilin-related protein [Gemmiger sp.]
MENIVREYMDKFGKDRTHKRRYACLLGVLALLVCLAVFWRLKLVGTAMTNEATCGLQEHTHTDECYEDVLVCGIATGETADGAEHEHTADCYQRQLVCDLPEHTHTPDCYSDAEADTETEADWAASFPQEALTGDWAQDTVLVAASQAGYTESTRNWQLADDGTRRGYTRYGAWYGNPYGDWNGMFAAFCLHYAGVDDTYLTAENAAGVNAWAVSLFNAGEWQGPDHEAVPGDVVFFGSDDKIESCAVVTDVYDENGVPTLSVLAGDVDNTVAELTIPTDSGSILGYAATADAYAAYEADHLADDISAENDTETTDETTPEDAATDKTGFVTLETNGSTTPVVQNVEGVNLLGTYTDSDNNTQDYIHNLDASSVEYTKDKDGKDGFSTKFKMEVVIPKDQLQANGNKAYYVLPKDIEITDSMANQEWTDFFDNTTPAGKYRFVKENGQWRVEIQFDESYMQSDKVKNNTYVYLQKFSFDAEEYSYTRDKDNKLVFKFSDRVTCQVDPSKIKHSNDETWDYDIKTEKKGEFLLVDNKLYYTVTVSSTKGTPDPITVEDTLTIPEGVTVGTRTITEVKKNGSTLLTKGDAASKDNATYKVSKDEENAFALELPGLAANESYTITYEYPLTNIPNNTNTEAKNTVTASSEDKSKGETVVSKKENVTVRINSIILKKNNVNDWDVDKQNHRIPWTIEVNDAHQNISGFELTDEMLKQLVDGSLEVSAWDENGQWVGDLSGTYELDKVNGKITFKEAVDGKNTYKYQIKYKTPYSAELDGTITNSASFGGQTDSGTAKVNGDLDLEKKADQSYTELPENGLVSVGWTVKINPTNGKIPAGWKFTDTTTVDNNGSNAYSHYMTVDQARAFVDALDESPLAGHYENLRFQINGVQGGWATVDQLSNDQQYIKVEFIVKDDVTTNKALELHYFTTGNAVKAGKGAEVTFRNYVKISDGEKEKATAGTSTVYQTGATKDVVGGTDKTLTSKDDTFMWFVNIQCAKDGTEHTYTVSDTLPDGVELISVGVGASADQNEIENNKRDQWFSFVDGTWKNQTGNYAPSEDDKKLEVGVGTQSGQTVTVTVKKPTSYSDDHFFVIFKCKFNDSIWENAQDGKVTTVARRNTAIVSREDGRAWTSNPSEINGKIDKTTAEEEVLTKSGDFKGWIGAKGRIEYTLNVNPSGKKLLEGEDEKKLTLTDTMKGADYGVTFELDRSTVQVINARTGNALNESEYSVAFNESTRTLTIMLPDQIPLIVKYVYNMTYSDGNMDYERNIPIENEAQLNGSSSTTTKDKEEIRWKNSSSSIEVGHSYTLIKVDADSATKCLEKAEFTLYAYDGGKFDLEHPIRTYTTDVNGVLNVSRYLGKDALEYNRAYYMVETNPPQGYEMPTNPQKFYFYLSNPDTKKYPECMPDGFKNKQGEYAGVLNLAEASKTVYVENKRLNADATIRKVWADGTPEERQNQSVKVDLMRIRVPQAVWENFYNDSGTITTPVKLTTSTLYNETVTQTYQSGTKVHIKYVQGRDNYTTASPAVTFVLNDTEQVATKQTGYAVQTTEHPSGYDVYEADIVLNKDTKITLKDALWKRGSDAVFIIPTGAGIGTSTWSDTATDRLTNLLSQYTPEPVTTGMEIYAGTDRFLYNLPIKAESDANSDRYIYYVSEQSVDGYVAALTMDGYGGSDSGSTNYTFTITNTPTTSYELPKTGGRGTLPYMAGGLALMAVSLLCAIYQKRKREGRQND